MGDFGDVDPTTGLGSNRYTGYGQIDPLAASVANGRITPAQWAAYQKKRRRDAIVGTTLTVGSMLGAGPLANAVGVGAGGAATLPSTSLIPGALATPGAGTAAAVLPSTSLIPAALKTAGADSMGYGKTQLAAKGVKAAANLFGSKKGADSATKSADMQTRAATEGARIQAQSSADQLAYIKRQSELDRLSKRFSDKQNYGLSSAGMMNDFNRYGDTSFNTRASELSQGRTQDKIYGGRQNQMNYMRSMLGMPQNELSVYVEPDALQLTRPTLPDYVDDTTPIE